MYVSVDRIKIIDCSKAVQSYLNALYLIKCHHKKAAGFAATSLHDCSFQVCVNVSDRMFVVTYREFLVMGGCISFLSTLLKLA